MPVYTQDTPENKGGLNKKVAPIGDHRMIVIESKEASASSGSDMIKMRHRILGPVGGPDFEEGEYLDVFDNLVFHRNALWKIDQFRAATGEKVVPGELVDVRAEDQDGKTFIAALGVEKDNKDRDRNRVIAYIIPEDSGF